MIKDKDQLITFLCVALRNFVVTHLGIKALEKNPVFTPKVTFGTKDKESTVPLKELCTDAATGKLMEPKELFDNCKRNLSRAILAETFELIKKYCQHSSQLDKFKTWKYYNFARILRNCTSHGTGGVLNKWPPELKKQGIIKVEWRGKIIDESMLGQRISMTDPEIIQLVFDEKDYIDKNLS